MKTQTLHILILLIISLTGTYISLAQSIHCDHIIGPEIEYINGTKVNPGDTFCIEPGKRPGLYIGNISGTPELPLVFINHEGIVEIESNLGYGISVANCRYIVLSGSGNSEQYGIHISSVPNGSGIKAGMLTSNLEITRLEISNTQYSGIVAKSDPTCSFESVRDSFTMYNTNIHHNYIHHVGNEGLYIGNSFYQGVNLNECDTTVLPHILDGVDIHHNIIEYTGWDGIQLGCALYNSQIHHNQIYSDSREERIYQMSGIMVNPGSSCDVYNNVIINGKGTGISMQGIGGQKIYNNLIVNSGKDYQPGNQTSAQKFGIYCKYEINEGTDSSFLFANNTIINPKSDGIRFQNRQSSDNIFCNNLIVNPGAYDYYENSGNTSVSGPDSYIYIYYDDIDFLEFNNIFRRTPTEIAFTDTLERNYNLLPESIAIDAGADLSQYGINTDILDQIRPFGQHYDVGAFEYAGTHIFPIVADKDSFINVFPNPSSNKINIVSTSQTQIISISIYSCDGKLMKQINTDSNMETINTKRLENGIYTLVVQLKNNMIINKKFLKI